jgi:hypothetical protein
MTVRSYNHSLCTHLTRSTPFLFHIPGWKFLESLALAAIDVGRIDVAQVGRLPIHGILVCGLAFISVTVPRAVWIA